MDHGISTADQTAARHEVEEVLHTTIYPGTEVMTDGTLLIARDQVNALLTVPFQLVAFTSNTLGRMFLSLNPQTTRLIRSTGV